MGELEIVLYFECLLSRVVSSYREDIQLRSLIVLDDYPLWLR
jgi:hypothetical protein